LLLQVLATEDDAAFVTTYRALLPREFQSAAELSRVLMLRDVKQEQRDHRMLRFTSHGEVSGRGSPAARMPRSLCVACLPVRASCACGG